MAEIDRSTQRAIAVTALLMLAAWALHGYLPGGERAADRERPASSPLALVVDLVLLSACVAIIGFAIITRLRDRRPRPSSAGPLPRGSGAMGRPTWRLSLIALAVIIAWLVLVLLLTRVGGIGPVEQPMPDPPTAPDATSAPPPTDVPEPREDAPPEPGTNVISYLIPPMLILMALIVAGTAIASRRQRSVARPYSIAGDPVETSAPAAASESLARAAQLGLAEIGDLSREPREAIIACYAAMERELTRIPDAVPQDFDTPTEVLARAVEHHALRADSATQLVELFEEARFSPHVMNEGHRDAAVRALQLVLDDVRSIA
ncbi:MAG TPA: DUF4129 domain-containing protein [Mycobacterium sp.]|nr:DUF4129 domain-containing protein [Mycobacterium sp.]